MNVRHDFPAPRLLKDVTGQRHPSPAHIMGCIAEELVRGMDQHQEHLPLWVMERITAAIRRANAEHDMEIAR